MAAFPPLLQLSYYGCNVELGKIPMNFYTQRLVSRSKDGLVRSMRNLTRAGASETKGVPLLRNADIPQPGSAGSVQCLQPKN
jgi:hypothetical protein